MTGGLVQLTCNVFSDTGFSSAVIRGDGRRVLFCESCAMGVIEASPDDGDAYSLPLQGVDACAQFVVSGRGTDISWATFFCVGYEVTNEQIVGLRKHGRGRRHRKVADVFV
jgi:hypothetical protein